MFCQLANGFKKAVIVELNTQHINLHMFSNQQKQKNAQAKHDNSILKSMMKTYL